MIDVIKQMVEALEWCHGGEFVGTADAIQAGRQAIAELESQEPVAWPEPMEQPPLYADEDPAEQARAFRYRAGWNDCLEKCKATITPPQRTEQEPVQDDHQLFIDSLPTDGDDKMFMQIDHWARKSYKRHQSSVRGQAITAADAFKSHIVWAALRWAKENTPPQRTWVGLTDDEFNELYDRYVPITCYALLIEKVEAKLKQKNGYAEEKNI